MKLLLALLGLLALSLAATEAETCTGFSTYECCVDDETFTSSCSGEGDNPLWDITASLPDSFSLEAQISLDRLALGFDLCSEELMLVGSIDYTYLDDSDTFSVGVNLEEIAEGGVTIYTFGDVLDLVVALVEDSFEVTQTSVSGTVVLYVCTAEIVSFCSNTFVVNDARIELVLPMMTFGSTEGEDLKTFAHCEESSSSSGSESGSGDDSGDDSEDGGSGDDSGSNSGSDSGSDDDSGDDSEDDSGDDSGSESFECTIHSETFTVVCIGNHVVTDYHSSTRTDEIAISGVSLNFDLCSDPVLLAGTLFYSFSRNREEYSFSFSQDLDSAIEEGIIVFTFVSGDELRLGLMEDSFQFNSNSVAAIPFIYVDNVENVEVTLEPMNFGSNGGLELSALAECTNGGSDLMASGLMIVAALTLLF